MSFAFHIFVFNRGCEQRCYLSAWTWRSKGQTIQGCNWEQLLVWILHWYVLSCILRCVACVDESVVVHMSIRYQFVQVSVYLMGKTPQFCLCFLPCFPLSGSMGVCTLFFILFGGLHDLLNYFLELSFLCILGCSLFTFLAFCLWFVSLGFSLQVQMICHYGVCIQWTYNLILFSQIVWIIYSSIYSYLCFRFCGRVASW